jgi:hypothetical protein
MGDSSPFSIQPTRNTNTEHAEGVGITYDEQAKTE